MSQAEPEDGAEAPEESVDKKVWRNVAGLVGGNTVGELLSLIVHAQMMNIMGPSGYGKLGQAQAVIDVSDGVAAFGLNQVGPVAGVDHKSRMGAYLGTLLAVRSVTTLLVLVVVFFLAPMLETTEAWILRLASLAILLSPLSNTASVPFFIHQDNWKIAWVPGVTTLVNIALLLGVLWISPTVEGVIGAIIATRMTNAILLSEIARRRYRFNYTVSRDIARSLMRIGPKAAWLDVVVILYSKASYFVLDGLGAVMLGVYTVADKIAQPILRVTGALSAASLSMFAELGRKPDVSELTGFYLRNLRRVAIALALIAIVVFAAVPPIIRTWFSDYEAALPVLYILYIGVCFMAVNQMTSSCLNGMGHFGWVATVASINLCLYAVGAWLWVDEYQAVGAAMATTFMEGCNSCMQVGLLIVVIRSRKKSQEASA